MEVKTMRVVKEDQNMKTKVIFYLRHLGALSATLGCAGIVYATDPVLTGTAGSGSSIDRLLAQAEVPNSMSGAFSVALPWYHRAFPESTFRRIRVPLGLSPERESTPVKNLSELLDEIRNEV